MAEHYIKRKHHAEGESGVGSVSFVDVFICCLTSSGGVTFCFFKPLPNSYKTRVYIKVSDHALGFWILFFKLHFDHAFKTTPCLLVVILFTCVLLEVLYVLHFFSSKD